MCVCLDVSMHICKQVRSEARGARSPGGGGGLGSLAVLSCQRWVLRTELGSSARAHTCNVLKILFLIICIYVRGVQERRRGYPNPLEPEVLGNCRLPDCGY